MHPFLLRILADASILKWRATFTPNKIPLLPLQREPRWLVCGNAVYAMVRWSNPRRPCVGTCSVKGPMFLYDDRTRLTHNTQLYHSGNLFYSSMPCLRNSCSYQVRSLIPHHFLASSLSAHLDFTALGFALFRFHYVLQFLIFGSSRSKTGIKSRVALQKPLSERYIDLRYPFLGIVVLQLRR